MFNPFTKQKKKERFRDFIFRWITLIFRWIEWYVCNFTFQIINKIKAIGCCKKKQCAFWLLLFAHSSSLFRDFSRNGFFFSFKYNFKVGNRNNNRSHAQMRHIFECARLELSECCDIIYRLQAIQLWFRLTLPFIRYLFRCVWVHLCANTHTRTHLNTNVRTTRKKMYTGENLHQKMIETLSKSVGWSCA